MIMTAPEETAVRVKMHLDPDVFLDFSLDAILRIVGAHAGSFFLWDEAKKEMSLKAVRGPYRDRVNAHAKYGEGILGWVSKRRYAVLVKNVQQDDRFGAVKRNGHYRSSSFMSVPILIDEKLLGVVNITERHDLDSFNEEDLLKAQEYARQIAMAYVRLLEVETLKRENIELRAREIKLKRELQENEPLVAIGKLAASLAHELNNPMDGIRRYVNFAIEQVMDDSVAREYLVKAKKGIRRSISVIRDLLQFSRESRRTGRLLEIHGLIEQCVDSFLSEQESTGVRFEKKFCGVPVYVLDGGLSLVLKNLYKNAADAMGGEGRIKLSTRLAGTQVTVVVQDTGSGIPETVLATLFEPYVSTKLQAGGNGIGLALSKDIVERCKGRIECDNAPEGGARFTITLPCQPNPVRS